MRFKFLSKYFPLPKFLTPHYIGVSFSDFNIKVISFDKNHQKPEFKNIIIPLEKGSIVNGKIENMNEVVAKLSTIKKLFGIPSVFFTIPDELIYIYQVSIPVGHDGDITEGVAFTIEENVPLPLDDTIFDFTPVKIVGSEDEYQTEVVVVACAKKELDKFTQAILSSGLSSVGCIHESQAITNAVVPKNFLGTTCIVHARMDRIGIYLIKDNIVHFSTLRSIVDGDYSDQFLDEYEKFLEYYLKYTRDESESRESAFVVCGEFEYAKKIVEPVIGKDGPLRNAKLANVWTNVLKIEDTTPNISYEDSLNFTSPVGAILSDIM